jgi:hypothetical protein
VSCQHSGRKRRSASEASVRRARCTLSIRIRSSLWLGSATTIWHDKSHFTVPHSPKVAERLKLSARDHGGYALRIEDVRQSNDAQRQIVHSSCDDNGQLSRPGATCTKQRGVYFGELCWRQHGRQSFLIRCEVGVEVQIVTVCHSLEVASLSSDGCRDARAEPNAQAQRRAVGMPRSEGTLSFRLHPSALPEAAPRERCSLLLDAD